MKQKIKHLRHPDFSRSYKQRINYEWSCPWILTDRKFPQFWPSILMLALLLSIPAGISFNLLSTEDGGVGLWTGAGFSAGLRAPSPPKR
jgi:hypothetical protein